MSKGHTMAPPKRGSGTKVVTGSSSTVRIKGSNSQKNTTKGRK